MTNGIRENPGDLFQQCLAVAGQHLVKYIDRQDTLVKQGQFFPVLRKIFQHGIERARLRFGFPDKGSFHVPAEFFQKILDTSGGSFRAVITAYRDQYVVPESHDAFNRVLDYSFVRSKVLSGEIVEVHYTRTDGAPYTLKITPYSSSGSHIHETIWIFADDTATLTPPPTQIKKQS